MCNSLSLTFTNSFMWCMNMISIKLEVTADPMFVFTYYCKGNVVMTQYNACDYTRCTRLSSTSYKQ